MMVRYVTRAALAVAVLGLAAGTIQAQPQAKTASRPFEISDNAFLIEEAFNQEATIFQNIFTTTRSQESGWVGSFTQEWPVGGQSHQFSYTVPFAAVAGTGGLTDALVNYRYQASTEGPHRPAFSPRVSVILPSGAARSGLGSGVVGWQVNLPVSKQLGDVYVHTNAGLTTLPGVHEAGQRVTLISPTVGASAIWRVRPMVHLMFETLGEFVDSAEPAGGTSRERALTFCPGVRGGWNVGPRQIVVGVGIPVRVANGQREAGVLTYFSYELPYRASSNTSAGTGAK